MICQYFPGGLGLIVQNYSLALQITDDPVEAVLLTHEAFIRTRKQLQNGRDEFTIVTMLVAAVIPGLNPRGLN
jgi:hypothetical protein